MALLAGCGLMGADNVPYIGVSVGNAELKTSVDIVNFESKNDDTHYTATLGQYVGDNGRVSLSYTYVEPTGNVQNSDAASLAFDFILPVIDNTLLLYVGPVIGYTRFEEEAAGLKRDLSGIHYGGQAGAIVRIVNNIEIEGGYRYLVETGKDTVLGVDVEADNLRMWYAGVNFRF
ncbi:MAG: outer membrane beta-barrel protein [Sulfurimonas sp.]|nr:outer membrane beta-barrel protein [Sulfurimonas sp.]